MSTADRVQGSFVCVRVRWYRVNFARSPPVGAGERKTNGMLVVLSQLGEQVEPSERGTTVSLAVSTFAGYLAACELSAVTFIRKARAGLAGVSLVIH